jgi:hypothetical protein
VLGWTGDVVPQELARIGELLHLGFTGTGMLMLSLPDR